VGKFQPQTHTIFIHGTKRKPSAPKTHSIDPVVAVILVAILIITLKLLGVING
jgi:hypothetical protein